MDRERPLSKARARGPDRLGTVYPETRARDRGHAGGVTSEDMEETRAGVAERAVTNDSASEELACARSAGHGERGGQDHRVHFQVYDGGCAVDLGESQEADRTEKNRREGGGSRAGSRADQSEDSLSRCVLSACMHSVQQDHPAVQRRFWLSATTVSLLGPCPLLMAPAHPPPSPQLPRHPHPTQAASGRFPNLSGSRNATRGQCSTYASAGFKFGCCF
jgi:hypothetical protein